LEAPRQNGKGAILEARELAGLFAFGERLIIHSAHEQATATEHFERILRLLEGVPEFDRRVLKVVRGKGTEAIKLRDGFRIFFKTRTGGGGRGFTGNLVVFDEAMMLAAAFMAALVPVMAAQSMTGDPQLWFAGSAVDQDKTEHGVEFARVRADALADGARLAYFGWNVPFDDPDQVPDAVLDDPEMWAMANPGLGIRISSEYIADERRTLGSREFAVERLGIGDWPDPLGQHSDIPIEAWRALTDRKSAASDPVCFAPDVKPDRSAAAIGVAGARADGGWHVEIVEHRPGTEWVAGRLADLTQAHSSLEVPVDKGSPAGALIPALEQMGVAVNVISASEQAQAYGVLVDAVQQARVRHRGEPELDSAIRGAAKRRLGEAWAWSRKTSDIDISPLVAVTNALWGIAKVGTGAGGFEW
jgi:hypothetical protein